MDPNDPYLEGTALKGPRTLPVSMTHKKWFVITQNNGVIDQFFNGSWRLQVCNRPLDAQRVGSGADPNLGPRLARHGPREEPASAGKAAGGRNKKRDLSISHPTKKEKKNEIWTLQPPGGKTKQSTWTLQPGKNKR